MVEQVACDQVPEVPDGVLAGTVLSTAEVPNLAELLQTVVDHNLLGHHRVNDVSNIGVSVWQPEKQLAGDAPDDVDIPVPAGGTFKSSLCLQAAGHVDDGVEAVFSKLEADGAVGVNDPSEGEVDAQSQRGWSKHCCGDESDSDLFPDANVLDLSVADDGHELLATVADNGNWDTPLTQFPPNLPGKAQGGESVCIPVDSQASEESRVIAEFFPSIRERINKVSSY
ncbi:Hypothetical predicted protein [Paramuricea clavata]|uniref:Uncharacterized protein n=1 Tax=Paramuricea clavata TaxID=317549 RepID=A0A6S7JXK8_PARCT|nr:Hypothetical predicted protein [Paramuricea clavata]